MRQAFVAGMWSKVFKIENDLTSNIAISSSFINV